MKMKCFFVKRGVPNLMIDEDLTSIAILLISTTKRKLLNFFFAFLRIILVVLKYFCYLMQHILLHWFIQLQKIQITYKLHITNTKEKEEILVKKLTFRIFHFSPYFANEGESMLNGHLQLKYSPGLAKMDVLSLR